jgi:hypothetical protein
MRLTMTRLIVGLIASVALTRLLQSQLFNVRPTDPLTLAGVSVYHPHRGDCLLRSGPARDPRRSIVTLRES